MPEFCLFEASICLMVAPWSISLPNQPQSKKCWDRNVQHVHIDKSDMVFRALRTLLCAHIYISIPGNLRETGKERRGLDSPRLTA